jgi:hypothetical protein
MDAYLYKVSVESECLLVHRAKIASSFFELFIALFT